MKSRTISRICVILLVAAPVIAVTWARFSPYDLAADLAAREAAAKGQAPAPGAETVLRRLIAAPPPRRGMDATKLGPLQSIGYLGSDSESPLPGPAKRIDRFRVAYRNGNLVWRVGLDKLGKPDTVDYFSPDPPTPAQTIIGFSHASANPGRVGFAMAVKFALLLAVAAIARLVLRIRL